jgi:hypothetical protein
MAKQQFPKELEPPAIATLLRGFATQIQNLKFPQLNVVKEIADDIGLVIQTREEFDRTHKRTTKQAIITILGSQLTHEEKLVKIAELVK